MAISFNRYVDITSGVGGAPIVTARELILRIFTTNSFVPPQTYLEFTTLADVGTWFGTTSEEYLRAAYYFSFVSKLITKPSKISFARWVKTAAAPAIYGATLTQTLTQLKTITNGSFGLTIGSTAGSLTALDFSAANSFADIATVLQTAIRAVAGAPNTFTQATVTYDSTAQAFNFATQTPSSGTLNVAISVQAGTTGTDVSTKIGWGSNAVFYNGSDVETITQTLTASDNASDNFGSFLFTTGSALTQDQYTEAANWNKAQNEKYMFMVPVNLSTALPFQQAMGSIGGTGATLSLLSTEYPEMLPTMILAATDYTRVNATQNYMFYQSTLTPSVTNDIDANTYDNLRINYYGQTQTAGKKLSFYQRGYLWGLDTDALDMNTYANEIWLKDAMKTSLGNLLLALRELPANTSGEQKIAGALQSNINQALINGVISAGKPLTNSQIAFISDVTGDPNAYRQIQNIGYWFGVSIQLQGTDYVAKYTLVYSKDDVIRKIIGSHVLI